MKTFVCHSYRDKPLIREVFSHIPDNIKTWIDEKNIIAGESLNEKIKNEIQDNADLVVIFLSRFSVVSDWVKKEVEWTLIREKQVGHNIIFPVLLDDDILQQVNLLGLEIEDRLYLKCVDLSESGVKAFAAKLNDHIQRWAPAPNSGENLWVRISNEKGIWQRLEQIAIQGVVNGGITAMGFYRDAWQKSMNINDDVKNPSTLADLQATIAILRTVDSMLLPVSNKLGCKVTYLGEETVYKELIEKDSTPINFHDKILGTQEFFENYKNTIRVIIDALDGTSNFSRGFPLFCSALAIFVEDQLRTAAIYDPIHNVVYSGLLPGSYKNPENFASAWAWNIASGDRKDLTISSKSDSARLVLKKEAVGVHLPRRNFERLEKFLKPIGIEKSILETLAKELGSIYALNSGLFAMAEIARGALGGFVNIITNPWDIAAGEVLVTAVGGIVSDFAGNKINYSLSGETSVIAARADVHQKICDLIKPFLNYI